MAKSAKNKPKKVVVDTAKKKKVVTAKAAKKLEPTKAKTKIKGKGRSSSTQAGAAATADMLFGRENFKWVFIGIALIVIGMFLMSGGAMPSPDVWEDDRIYSFRRITLATMLSTTLACTLLKDGVDFYSKSSK
ncbi:MAG: DUF3098 domain-containing protein, partial [Bacteroidota bacterium]